LRLIYTNANQDEKIGMIHVLEEIHSDSLPSEAKMGLLLDALITDDPTRDMEDHSTWEELMELYQDEFEASEADTKWAMFKLYLNFISGQPFLSPESNDTDSDVIEELEQNLDDDITRKTEDGLQIEMAPHGANEVMSNMLYAANQNVSQLTVYGSKFLRLYNNIIEADENDLNIASGLTYEDVLDLDYVLHPESMKRAGMSEDVVTIFTLGTELINNMLIHLLRNSIFDESRWSNSARDFVHHDLESGQRLSKLLYYAGVIDNGLRSEISKSKSTRNELVHNLDEQAFLQSMEDISNEVNTLRRAVQKLHQAAYDETLIDRIEREINGSTSA